MLLGKCVGFQSKPVLEAAAKLPECNIVLRKHLYPRAVDAAEVLQHHQVGPAHGDLASARGHLHLRRLMRPFDDVDVARVDDCADD